MAINNKQAKTKTALAITSSQVVAGESATDPTVFILFLGARLRAHLNAPLACAAGDLGSPAASGKGEGVTSTLRRANSE